MLARNWRNLIVLAPLAALIAANVVFHVEAVTGGDPRVGSRFGLSATVFLIALIGGRIIPAFTRNWLAAREVGRMPVQANRFDQAALAVVALGLASWTFAPVGPAPAVLLAAAAALHLIRLCRWAGERTLPDPLLLVLHMAYAALPIGLAMLAAAAWKDDWAVQVAGLHVLGVGGVGGMTLAVMARASLGHTGHPLRSTPLLNVAFLAVAAAALGRAWAALATDFRDVFLQSTAAAWIAAYALFLAGIGPILLRGRRREGNDG